MSQRFAPQPVGAPVLGHLMSLRREPLGFITRTMRDHGGLVRLKVGPRHVHLVTHPDYVQEILLTQARDFDKQTPGFAQVRHIVGDGLLTSDGELWRRQRRIAQPEFRRSRIASFAGRMARAAADLAESWDRKARDEAVLDVDREMMELTLRVVSETLLSTDVVRDGGSDLGPAIDFLLLAVRRRMVPGLNLPLWVPTPHNVRFRRSLAKLDRVIRLIIDNRRSGKSKEDDLLQQFMDAQDPETGERMSDTQLRDEVLTMFLAGHETTANALSWTWFLLSEHSEARERLWAEIDEVLGDRPPAPADLPGLGYLSRVLDESMRLYPPAWMFGRQPIRDVTLGEYHVPQGETMLVCAYAVHRAPEFWEDPETFDPDRFLPERVATHHQCQYFPFGAGSRMCIGKGFALLEAQLILATLAQRFRLDLVPGHRVVPECAVTLRLRHGLRMTVRRR